MHRVPIKNFFVGEKEPLTLFCGPCVIESREHALLCARQLKEILLQFPDIHFVFKASYDKANRSSLNSFRGVGLVEGLKILQEIQESLDLPVLTDVHSVEEARQAGQVVDVVQIPAFLCRQTDILLAAGYSQAVVNVKKGQFLAPWQMRTVVEKLLSTGNEKIILTDRGTSFGYQNLVSDMRAIPTMQKFGFPVCFDATHSVQLPGGLGDVSGGERDFIPTLTYAALAAGANALFLEAHPNPKEAKSDASTVVDFKELPALLKKALKFYQVAQAQ